MKRDTKMKRYLPLLVCVTVWAMVSCSPKISSNIAKKVEPQPTLDDVVLLREKDPLPADARWLGDMEMKLSANYEKMADIMRRRGWSNGAKYVKVNSYNNNGIRSDYHVMNVSMYWSDTTQVIENGVKIIDRNGNVIGSYDADNGTPNLSQKPVTSLDLLGVNGFRVYAGYGRRLNKVAPDLTIYEREHVKRLKNGEVLGIEYIRYFDHHKGNGLGLRYHIMHGSSADAATLQYENGTTVDGVLNESVNISFFGPVYSGRAVSSNGKHLFVDNVGAGLLLYNDRASFNGETVTIMGRTFGTTLDFNYSYFINGNLSLGADVSLTSGIIRRVTAKSGYNTVSYDLPENQFEGLVHLGISAQLVYTF